MAMQSPIRRMRHLARDLITRSARDVTDACAARSALVVAPHPDDETLGCGATILRKRAAGVDVTILMVTDGSHSHDSPSLPPVKLAERRGDELREAVARLGLPASHLRTAGLEDGTVAAHQDELSALVIEMIRELQPDEVYCTSALEPHPDHAAVGRAVRAAGAMTDASVLEYPVWLWGSWPAQRGRVVGSTIAALSRIVLRRGVAVRTNGFTEAKDHALEAHQSQLGRPMDVAPDEPWAVLPADVLRAARGRRELFFPV